MLTYSLRRVPLLAATVVLPFSLASAQIHTSTSSQAPAKPPVHRGGTSTAPLGTMRPVKPASPPAQAASSSSGCVSVPTLSPTIPAVPAGVGCAKSLYALKFEASHIDPQVSEALRTSLEALDQNFSLNYIDTKIGTGELAQPHKYYTVNYTGYLVDGTKFDSSLDAGREPITFPYGAHQVIQGWDTGFEGMHTGGKRRLFVPYQLAYGERGKPPTIPAKSMLVFDVEFLSQSDTPPAPKTPPAPATPPDGQERPPTGSPAPPAGSAAAPTESKPATPDQAKPAAPTEVKPAMPTAPPAPKAAPPQE